MPAMRLERLRNIGIVAHIDAGKTTVSERILFVSGVEHKIGQVDEGTAVMDWMPEERERGITITAAATTLPWRGCVLNLIDTPGHVDFTIEVERCMRVLDGAILVIDAVAGVQAQSESVWRAMRRHRVPAVVFVNKCDRPGADFLAAVRSVRKRLEAPAVPVQYPLYDAGELTGVVDLLERRAWRFPAGDGQAGPVEAELPAELADEIGILRSELIDALADGDDELLAAVLEEREPTAELLRSALRRRTLDNSLVPVVCGAALRSIGIQPLLDAVVDYLPSPLDVPPITGVHPETGAPVEREASDEAPAAALAFKVQAEAHGDLVYVRVYSGTLAPGTALWNPRTRRHERVGRLLRMHSDSRTALEKAGAGDIVALTGLKATSTGDTLCAPAQPLLLEPLAFPEPVISMVVEPRSTTERDKLRAALARLAREDPSFHQVEDESTGQWLISGMGELHLEVALHRLASEQRVEANVGQPRVAYREAIRSTGRGSGRVERALLGKEVFGAVELVVEPLPGEAAAVEVAIEPAAGIPAAFREPVRNALLEAAQVGPRFGFPLLRARVRVVGGESRPRLDAEPAFTQAAALALRKALEDSEVDLLEPLMSFEVQSPAEFSSGILADLNSRRAEVGGVEAQGALRVLSGTVPLSQMFGYSTAVRSLSQGRAAFSMLPAGYRVVPPAELAARGLTWG
jgi:elongation factor G